MAKYGYVASNVDFPEQNSQHFAPTTQIIMPPTQHYNYNYSLHHQQSDSSDKEKNVMVINPPQHQSTSDNQSYVVPTVAPPPPLVNYNSRCNEFNSANNDTSNNAHNNSLSPTSTIVPCSPTTTCSYGPSSRCAQAPPPSLTPLPHTHHHHHHHPIQNLSSTTNTAAAAACFPNDNSNNPLYQNYYSPTVVQHVYPYTFYTYPDTTYSLHNTPQHWTISTPTHVTCTCSQNQVPYVCQYGTYGCMTTASSNNTSSSNVHVYDPVTGAYYLKYYVQGCGRMSCHQNGNNGDGGYGLLQHQILQPVTHGHQLQQQQQQQQVMTQAFPVICQDDSDLASETSSPKTVYYDSHSDIEENFEKDNSYKKLHHHQQITFGNDHDLEKTKIINYKYEEKEYLLHCHNNSNYYQSVGSSANSQQESDSNVSSLVQAPSMKDDNDDDEEVVPMRTQVAASVKRPLVSRIDRVLEDFKCAKGDGYVFKDILGHFTNFCLDQTGSRFLQEHILTATKDEIDLAFEEMEPHAMTLMHDVFGNYIVQLMFEKGDVKQRQRLAYIIRQNMLDLSLHVYGCRVVQRALEVVDHDTKIHLVSQLDGFISRCIKNMNGNHVIQKAVQSLNVDNLASITDTINERVVQFSVHPYGCRVVQRILERMPHVSLNDNDDEYYFRKKEIISQILTNINELVQDQYGNYVVQHVLVYGEEEERKEGLKSLVENLTDYACHKYASNVIERGLQCGTELERMMIFDAITKHYKTTATCSRELAYDPLFRLMTNRFGNYVVQRLLEVVMDDQKNELMTHIMGHVEVVKRFKYGKHIIAYVESLLKKK